MKPAVLTWAIFSAALALVLAVMLFFTIKMLQFEKSTAIAEARAGLEENIRLALWRMDSAAAILLSPKNDRPSLANNINSKVPEQKSAQMRLDPEFQNQLSFGELQQRGNFSQFATSDWTKIAPALLERVGDILPGATLEAVAPSDANPNDTRRLAAIPARLVIPASALPSAALPWNTPLRVSLLIAWGCVLVATVAVAQLLAVTLSLSERRGAFASAVTHELRTPLTTCRMYAEMLSSEMVVDPGVRKHYLDTLVAETDRLGYLIENVLAYSRLEKRIASGRAEPCTVNELIHRILPTLQRRVDQAGLALDVKIGSEAAEVVCNIDIVSVQQILLNLVDNACKYGQTAIEIAVQSVANRLEIRVIDRGPGIDARRAARLFTAFSKSRTDTTAGIGLGLYLSRRLARDMRGDLLFSPAPPGAVFILVLQI